MSPDRLGIYLASQIHFHRRVDRNEVWFAAYDARIVNFIYRLEQERRAGICKFVQALRTIHETSHDAAWVIRLPSACDDAAFGEIDYPVRQHLAVNPKISAISEFRRHSVGNGAAAYLDGGAIVYQCEHICGNLRRLG